nr:MAG TPA_asm: hypothetical protein [Caudoviricetes sp.]
MKGQPDMTAHAPSSHGAALCPAYTYKKWRTG